MMMHKRRRYWERSSSVTLLLMSLELRWRPPPLLPSKRLGGRRKCLGPPSHIPHSGKLDAYLITRVQSYSTRAIPAYETQELETNLDIGPAVAWRRPRRYPSTWSSTRCRPIMPPRSTRPSKQTNDDVGRVRGTEIGFAKRKQLNRRRAIRGMAPTKPGVRSSGVLQCGDRKGLLS